MPQINNFEDERIKAIANFRGIRRCFLFRWIPFVTGGKPKISLKIESKQSKFKVKTVSIDCDAPKHREDSLYETNYGWFTKDFKVNEKYEITLPMLDRAGNYEYRMNVHMKYTYKGKETDEYGNPYTIHSSGKIMSTGKVSWVETIITSLLFLIMGSGLTFLIQWIIS